MPRLLSILGFVAFVLGAVGIAVGLYILLAGVLHWNPLSNGRPPVAGTTEMGVIFVISLVLLLLGALLARLSARAAWRREMEATAGA